MFFASSSSFFSWIFFWLLFYINICMKKESKYIDRRHHHHQHWLCCEIIQCDYLMLNRFSVSLTLAHIFFQCCCCCYCCWCCHYCCCFSGGNLFTECPRSRWLSWDWQMALIPNGDQQQRQYFSAWPSIKEYLLQLGRTNYHDLAWCCFTHY